MIWFTVKEDTKISSFANHINNYFKLFLFDVLPIEEYNKYGKKLKSHAQLCTCLNVCIWFLQIILVVFHAFATDTNLEYPPINEDSADYVSVYEGNSFVATTNYSGNLGPFSYYSRGNQLSIRFRTNYNYVRNGFMFSVEYVGKLTKNKILLVKLISFEA